MKRDCSCSASKTSNSLFCVPTTSRFSSLSETVTEAKSWFQRCREFIGPLSKTCVGIIPVIESVFFETGEAYRACSRVSADSRSLRTDDAELVTAIRQPWQQFRETHAWCPRGDRPKGAPVFHRCVRFRVDHVDMTGTTPKPQQQNRLRFRSFSNLLGFH